MEDRKKKSKKNTRFFLQKKWLFQYFVEFMPVDISRNIEVGEQIFCHNTPFF